MKNLPLILLMILGSYASPAAASGQIVKEEIFASQEIEHALSELDDAVVSVEIAKRTERQPGVYEVTARELTHRFASVVLLENVDAENFEGRIAEARAILIEDFKTRYRQMAQSLVFLESRVNGAKGSMGAEGTAGVSGQSAGYVKVWVELPTSIKDESSSPSSGTTSETRWLAAALSLEGTMHEANGYREVDVLSADATVFQAKFVSSGSFFSNVLLIRLADLRGAVRTTSDGEHTLGRLELDLMGFEFASAPYLASVLQPYFRVAAAAGLRIFNGADFRGDLENSGSAELGLRIQDKIWIFGRMEYAADEPELVTAKNVYAAGKTGLGWKLTDRIELTTSLNYRPAIRRDATGERKADVFYLLPEGWSMTGGIRYFYDAPASSATR